MYIVALVWLSEIDVAYCFTVTEHCALRFVPSVVFAVITAVPVEFAVTTPVDDTVATLVLLEVQVTEG